MLKNKPTFKKKQTGVTLVTSLMFLLVMTITGVSVVKVSSMNVLIAGSEQRDMMIRQNVQSELNKFATVESLAEAYTATGFMANEGDDKYRFDAASVDNLHLNKVIKDNKFKYTCKRDGTASGIGADAPLCRVYDYFLEARESNSSAADGSHRGAGKMLPNSLHSADATEGVYNFAN